MTGSTERRGEPVPVARPAMDSYATPDAVELFVDLPGVPRDAIGLTVQGAELLLEADRPATDGRPAGASRLPRRFRRLFTLPDGVDRDGIRAAFRDGVLHLTLPRAERGGRTIPVEEA